MRYMQVLARSLVYATNLAHHFTDAGGDTFGSGGGTIYISHSTSNKKIETTMSDFRIIAGSGTGGFGFKRQLEVIMNIQQ